MIGQVIAAIEKHCLEVVQMGSRGIPQHRFGYRNRQLFGVMPSPQHESMAAGLPARVGHIEPETEGLVGWTVECDIHSNLLTGHVRSDPKSGQVGRGPALDIDALPDAADGSVPALLSVRDFGEGE